MLRLLSFYFEQNFTASYDFLEDRDVDTNHNPGEYV